MQGLSQLIDVCIIDDSRLARAELRRLLADYEYVRVTGEAANADQAVEVIEKNGPDLIFLDIQMPGKDGFRLLEELDTVPNVVFVTAYDEYAVKAFEVNALDYLTKPVKSSRLEEVLLKVKNTQIHSFENSTHLHEESRVFVKDGERCWFVRVGDIFLIESDGNYAKIHFEDQQPMILKTLDYLEKRLNPELFFRANRSQIVNLRRIERVDPWFGQSIRIELANGVSVEVSRRRSKEFRERMSF